MTNFLEENKSMEKRDFYDTKPTLQEVLNHLSRKDLLFEVLQWDEYRKLLKEDNDHNSNHK